MIRRHIADYKIIDFGDVFDEKFDHFCSTSHIYRLSFGRVAVIDLGIPTKTRCII